MILSNIVQTNKGLRPILEVTTLVPTSVTVSNGDFTLTLTTIKVNDYQAITSFNLVPLGTYTVSATILELARTSTLDYSVISKQTLNLLYSKYDSSYYTEPDGSKWVRIFHHNNPAGNLFSSSDDFVNSVYKNTNMWFDLRVINYLSKYEFMIKLNVTAGSAETKYRWTLVNPWTAKYADVAPAKITKNTSSGYTVASSKFGGIYLAGSDNNNTKFVCNNGTQGNWWCALGCWTAYNGGIPGYNEVVPTTGFMDLYVRIDT